MYTNIEMTIPARAYLFFLNSFPGEKLKVRRPVSNITLLQIILE